ncbi:MAG TPA: GH116 family glycosyl hydrolase [Gemmataceae bacterium]|nr:GH116 family glycosyl hydrolase [Gemmataceae bacterium]
MNPMHPHRRDFLQLVGLGTLSLVAESGFVAGPFAAEEAGQLVPLDKKLSPEWVRALTARGEPEVYRGAETALIGMPVGGLCAGQLYLGGDGKLWHWDVFNQVIGTGDAHYEHPPKPDEPLDQGFAVRVETDGKAEERTLDRTGFPNVAFRGEYPIGKVEYAAEGFPVRIALEAFAPFIPLNAADSSLPATVMHFTVKNVGQAVADVQLAGWLQNAVGPHTDIAGAELHNRIRMEKTHLLLECSAEAGPPENEGRPPIVFADFEGKDYGDWKVSGEAFGTGPVHGTLPNQQPVSGYEGQGLVNSYLHGDDAVGQLTSPEFAIERRYVSFLIGGGNHPGKTCINLLVDGKILRTATGKDNERLEWHNWDVRDLAGKKAHIEIVDAQTGPWGHINIDQIEFRDDPRGDALTERPDFGTMGLALVGREDGDSAIAALPDADRPAGLFAKPAAGSDAAKTPLDGRLRGGLRRRWKLEPGQEATAVFLVTWRFPNLRLPGFAKPVGRWCATRFTDAAAVASYIAENIDRLSKQTRLWRDVWYDSTLPYWMLDRLFANTSILATSTCHRFADGRFYGWEGVGCCVGTCAHVWHYAHAPARLFPELERSAREMQDFGTAWQDSGLIRFRGETAGDTYATDGQSGVVLRSYREHQMSADDAFLKRNWPKIKKATEYLIGHDRDHDGVLKDAQPNTLDTAYYGPNSAMTSLYLAALRAAEEMAREVGDDAFAKTVRPIFESGSEKVTADLWNGAYFYHKPDPKHPEALKIGTGCFIDQVFGQSWAFQVGLGRILPEDKTRQALQSLWKYNWTPDVGPYRKVYPNGRWYAMPGEGGLIMCTWPKGGREGVDGNVNPGFAGYFNECMNGFEYQAAGHMIWEGLLTEGLSVCRSLHERHHASRRNPWNEVECGDHYARSMASYGVFLATCGFEYHGPKGHFGFTPRLGPDDFRAAFTSAEGWGTITQKRENGTQQQTIEVRWGKLRLTTLAFAVADGLKPTKASVQVGDKAVEAEHDVEGERVRIVLKKPLVLMEGQRLEAIIG